MLRWISAFLCVLTFALGASAEVVLYDSQGFEAPVFSAGSTPVGQPASAPEAEQWQAFGGSPTAYRVESGMAAAGSQAVQANGGGLNDGSYVWPNLGVTPADNELIRIQVDIARTLSPTVVDSSPVYAVDIYDFDFNRTSRFGLQNPAGTSDIRTFVSVPINAQGQIDPAGPGIRSEFYGPAIAENMFVHFDFLMDYENKTVSLTVNGTRLASLIPFRTQESTTLDSAELQVGTFNNLSADNGWFDNYIVSKLLKGDYNNNGVVDAGDYVIWEKTLSSTTVLAADGNGNGAVDAGDLDVWRAHFGETLPGSGSGSGFAANAIVPEPASIAMLMLGSGAIVATARRRRNRGRILANSAARR